MVKNHESIRSSFGKDLRVWGLIGFFSLLYLPLFFLLFSAFKTPSFLALIESNIVLWFKTLVQASMSAALSVILGLGVASLWLSRGGWFATFLQAFSLVPFVLPPILVILAFVIVWGNNGWINNLLFPTHPLRFLYHLGAVVVVHAFYNFGICARFIASSWGRLSSDYEKTALSLGASPRRAFFTVILPHLKPAILSSFAIVFCFCFMSFPIVLLLGGGPQNSSFEIAIYQMMNRGASLPEISVLVFVQWITCFSLFLLLLLGRRIFSLDVFADRRRVLRKKKYGTLDWGMLIFYGLFLLPLLALIVSFFFNLKFESLLFFTQRSFYRALETSLILSLSAAFCATLGGAFCSFFFHSQRSLQFIEWLAILPLTFSPLMIALSYFLFWKPAHGQAVVFMVHSLLGFPFVLRSISTGWHTISPSIHHSSLLLGASALRRHLTVTLPLLWPSISMAFLSVLALSLGELSSALLFLPPHSPTLSVLMYHLFARYRIADAIRVGSVLVLLSFFLFIILEGLQKKLWRHRDRL